MLSIPEKNPSEQENNIPIATMRHSTAHLMAAAIQKLWPDTQFGVGPSIDNGFYYDFKLPDGVKLAQEDHIKIEEMMLKLKNEKLPIKRIEMSIDEAIVYMEKQNQPFKVDLLKLLKEKGSTAVEKETGDEASVEENAQDPKGVSKVSFYTLGDFVDLCRGPHVENTEQIGCFKLHQQSSAYWRGDENKPVLNRLYGYGFKNIKEMESEIKRIEEASQRDHRKIGKELGIFTFSEDVGPGLPLWLPNGVAMRQELELLAESTERKFGYQRVSMPVLTKEKLFIRSGHLPYYKNDMYSPMDIEGEKYYLKPMNCPHHHQAYLAEPRSWRDLPLRIAEYGNVFRYESTGAMSGIMRTRGFTQNDAHIYCTYEQAKEEFLGVMRLHAYYYDLLKITNYYMRLSLPDSSKLKYVDNPKAWEQAIRIIKEAMTESGLKFKEVPGEAAFYGPKIDFIIENVIGREYAISTNQLDFLASERFKLEYTAQDGTKQPVYVIHRAPLGSHERFIAFLLEQYLGRFPVWLSPVQIRVIPVTGEYNDYAESIHKKLFNAEIHNGTHGLRVEVSTDKSQTLQKKIAMAQEDKIPYMVIVGKKEEANKTISIRLRSGEQLNNITLDEFIERLKKEIYNRQDIESEKTNVIDVKSYLKEKPKKQEKEKQVIEHKKEKPVRIKDSSKILMFQPKVESSVSPNTTPLVSTQPTSEPTESTERRNEVMQQSLSK